MVGLVALGVFVCLREQSVSVFCGYIGKILQLTAVLCNALQSVSAFCSYTGLFYGYVGLNLEIQGSFCTYIWLFC